MYILNTTVTDVIKTIYNGDKFQKFSQLLADLTALNSNLIIRHEFDFPKLEEELITTINASEMNDDLIVELDFILIDNIKNYIQLFGISLKEDNELTLFMYIDFINLLYMLYSPTNEMLEDYIDMMTIDVETSEIEHLGNIISNMINQPSEKYEDAFDYVDNDFFRNLSKFYQKELDARQVELSSELMNVIEEMRKLEPRLIETRIMRNICRYGYTPMTFEMMRDDLYHNIQLREKQSYEEIAFELAAVLFIATDTRCKEIILTPDIVNLTWADELFKNEFNKKGSDMIKNSFYKIQAGIQERLCK